MGFFGKTIKKSLKKIKNGLSKYSRSNPNNTGNFSEYEEPVYEEVTYLDSTKTTLLTPLRSSEAQATISHNLIEFSPDTPPPRSSIKFQKVLETALVTPKTDSSSDSGISDTTGSKRKIKKLQFSSNLVEEFESDPVETELENNMIFKAGQVCKAKYYETQSPQKVELVPSAPEIHLLFTQLERDKVQIVNLPKCDTIDVSRYSQSPPKPMRSAYRMKKIQEQQKIFSSSESDDNASPKLKPLKPILRHRLPSSLPSSSEDEMTVIPKYDKCPEVVYAQVTPRHSRHLKSSVSSNGSSPEPSSSASTTPGSSKENLLSSVESSSKDSLPNLPRSEDFLPEASSSINNIQPASAIKKNQIWPRNNFLSDESQRPLSYPQSSPEKTQSVEDILSETTKKSLALIHETNWSLNKEHILKNHECHREPKSPIQSAVENKFVVNAYESRRSIRRIDEKKINYRAPLKPNSPKLEIIPTQEFLCQDHRKLDETIKNLENESLMLYKENKIESSGSSVDSDGIETLLSDNPSDSNRTNYCGEQNNNNIDGNNNGPMRDSIRSNLYRQQRDFYKLLRQTKDRNYKVMVEASNALEEVNRSGKRSVDKILVIQKVLLETNERVQIINKQITDLSYAQIKDNCPNKATITLSNIDIPLKPMDSLQKKNNKKYTENFLITVSHGIDLFVSEFIEERTDLLSLSQKFTFENMPPDFEIKVKLFWVRLKNSKKKIRWGRLFKPSTSKIVYQDHVVNEFHQKEVFNTSFQLCGEATLTREHIDKGFSELMIYPKVFPRISGRIRHYVHCEIDTNADMSGFLDVGTRKNDVLFWCTKYCVLKENDFWIYNDPNDWQFGREPAEKINLSFCFGPIIKKIDNCSKPRCFQLTTARPTNGSHNVTLKSKPNFMQKRFYFAAREKKEFDDWTRNFDQLYHSLRLFKKLFLDKEYENYSKSLL